MENNTLKPQETLSVDLNASMKFCSWCNYCVDKVQIEQARFDFDCPNCGQAKLSMFYSYGSHTHMLARESYERVKYVRMWKKTKVLIPLPFPTPNAVKENKV